MPFAEVFDLKHSSPVFTKSRSLGWHRDGRQLSQASRLPENDTTKLQTRGLASFAAMVDGKTTIVYTQHSFLLPTIGAGLRPLLTAGDAGDSTT